MASNPLLSTYRAGENRVTSSIMAVLERLDLALVRDLMAAATGTGDELRAVTFENQVVSSGSVPDARVSGHFTWWFETKTVRGVYGGEGHDRQQLREHATLLEQDPDAVLFVLTPDPAPPAWFEKFDDGVPAEVRDRIVWLSFRQLADTVEEITRDPGRMLGEQTRFLLAELVDLFEADGLLTNDDTVIVAARSAWPEYQKISAYVCQPNRSFRDGLTHLGFYANGAIQPLVPRIRARHANVLFTKDEAEQLRQADEQEVAQLIDHLLSAKERTEGEAYGVVLLSSPGDPETVKLPGPILNDTVSAAGRPWAWTLGQRYTSLSRLTSDARVTSDL